MAEAQALWSLLREASDHGAAAGLEQLVESGSDRALNRINALAFAAEHDLNEEVAIGTLVHAARIELFDMSGSVRCPGCGGVLETGAALKTLNRSEYLCSLCADNYEPTIVEVTFTVNPRIRRIAAHDPDCCRFRNTRATFFSVPRSISQRTRRRLSTRSHSTSWSSLRQRRRQCRSLFLRVICWCLTR
jgi:Family of unknown function (DUF5939)